MGTNYYKIELPPDIFCPHCNKIVRKPSCNDVIHIGKSSVGWKFTFHKEAFINPHQWKHQILKEKWYIVDENYNHITRKAFIKFVDWKQFIGSYTNSRYENTKTEIIGNYQFLAGEFS